ncbi:MAG: hypothetical protein H6Q82_1194, partial [Deltaproteobacteria bacterium]|nr:hypothetical protein [Deltaproteobacteria bacterium]
PPGRRSSVVEQLIRNQQVVGSIPTAGSTKNPINTKNILRYCNLIPVGGEGALPPMPRVNSPFMRWNASMLTVPSEPPENDIQKVFPSALIHFGTIEYHSPGLVP